MSKDVHKLDKELQEYKDLMDVPSHFDEGFSLTSFMGAIFVALVMIPGALYMQLVAGVGVGPAAQWVTVILFIELAKRANATLKRAQIFILFYMAGAVIFQNVHGTPLFTQFLVQSDAATSFGLADLFPTWVAPKNIADLPVRSFFQAAWMPAIALIAFKMFFSKLDTAILGYGLFRLTSDVEKLPFPMAPMHAQGMLTLAEDLETTDDKEKSWRWRAFSIGGAIGMGFSFIYMGIPILTGAFLRKTIQVFPIPFVDWTEQTGELLPAVATGLSFDLGQIILGMVMPFYAMVGSFVGLIITVVANPILYETKILFSWKPGQSTVETLFNNNINFYFSFGIGLALAIAIVGIFSVIRARGKKAPDAPKSRKTEIPESRGDIPNWLVLIVYFFTTSSYIIVSSWLIDWHKGVMLVMFFFGFIYTPLISYVTARLEGIAGQVVQIPFIREISFILSGYKGVAIWFIPVPMANYGQQTVFYKTAELTGTRFRSIWKADVFLFPIILIAMLAFSSFIYGLAEIPSSVYPYTQEIWEFEAKNASLIYSSTLGYYSPFNEALNGIYIAIGTVIGIFSFGTFAMFGAPTTLCYGIVRGFNQTLPHVVLPQFLGAILGQFFFRKKFGKNWKKYIIVISAGYFVGAGLISMLCIGIVFLKKAASALPF